MLKTNVLDMSGKVVGEIELSEAVFGIEPNKAVVHDVVKNHLAVCNPPPPKPSPTTPGTYVQRQGRIGAEARKEPWRLPGSLRQLLPGEGA